MPLPQPPKGFIRITLQHVSNGKQWATHFWANIGSSVTPTVAQLNTFAAAVETEWKAQFVPAFSASTTYEQTLAEWHDGTGGTIIGASASPANGTDTNPVNPLSICWVITWRITASYRGGKPRMYLSGTTQHLLGATPNTWGAGITAAFTTAATHMLGVVNALTVAGASVTMGTVSYFKDAAERAGAPPPVARTTPLFRAYTSGIMRPLVGHQRDRDRP